MTGRKRHCPPHAEDQRCAIEPWCFRFGTEPICRARYGSRYCCSQRRCRCRLASDWVREKVHEKGLLPTPLTSGYPRNTTPSVIYFTYPAQQYRFQDKPNAASLSLGSDQNRSHQIREHLRRIYSTNEKAVVPQAPLPKSACDHPRSSRSFGHLRITTVSDSRVSISALASCKSAVSKPSVNWP